MNRTIGMIFSAVLTLGILAGCSGEKFDDSKDTGGGGENNLPIQPALDLPRDADGWTVFTPSSDTRIMYVSSSGDDATAVEYTSASNVNPFDPQGTVYSFKTYKAAKAHTRSGYPDWVLFKRGDTFTEDLCIDDDNDGSILSGRSANEPALVGAYGATGISPVFKVKAGGIQVRFLRGSSHFVGEYIAICGLAFYSYTRNPADSAYNSAEEGDVGICIWQNANNKIRNILVEGCSSSFFSTGMSVYSSSTDTTSYVENIEIRRNIIMNAYSNSGAHSQGMWASRVRNFLVDENVFDHNGWLIQATLPGENLQGQATMFNHNTYTCALINSTFRNNIFTRASSIGTKFTAPYDIQGLTINDNLYVDNELGLNVCSNYPERLFRVKGATIKDNVFYNLGRSNQTKRNVSWGMDIAGWDGGSVYNNLMVHNLPQPQGLRAFMISEGSRNVDMHDNVVHNSGGVTSMVWITDTPVSTKMTLRNNYFEMHDPNNLMFFSSTIGGVAGVTFSGNNYYPTAPLFRIASNSLDFSQWKATYESNATFTKRTFPDASRTVETYMASLGETGTLDAFIEKCRTQDRFNWDIKFTADTVNSYLRTGFGMTE